LLQNTLQSQAASNSIHLFEQPNNLEDPRTLQIPKRNAIGLPADATNTNGGAEQSRSMMKIQAQAASPFLPIFRHLNQTTQSTAVLHAHRLPSLNIP